jgi:hypothetical protein
VFRRVGLVRWWELSHWITRSRVWSSLSADFAGGRLASVFPFPKPTHVEASGTGSALFLGRNVFLKLCGSEDCNITIWFHHSQPEWRFHLNLCSRGPWLLGMDIQAQRQKTGSNSTKKVTTWTVFRHSSTSSRWWLDLLLWLVTGKTHVLWYDSWGCACFLHSQRSVTRPPPISTICSVVLRAAGIVKCWLDVFHGFQHIQLSHLHAISFSLKCI